MTPDSWSNALTVMETLLVQICEKWAFAGANGLEMVWYFALPILVFLSCRFAGDHYFLQYVTISLMGVVNPSSLSGAN